MENIYRNRMIPTHNIFKRKTAVNNKVMSRNKEEERKKHLKQNERKIEPTYSQNNHLFHFI